jgi:hypothetical protein
MWLAGDFHLRSLQVAAVSSDPERTTHVSPLGVIVAEDQF